MMYSTCDHCDKLTNKFKFNSILQNRLVRWSLHYLYIMNWFYL